MDDFYLVNHRPFVARLRDGDRVMTKRKGRLEINYITGDGDEAGVMLEGDKVGKSGFHKHGLSVVWNGPMPDDDDMAKRYVRWREENGDKPFMAWVVVAAPDHFMVMPLVDWNEKDIDRTHCTLTEGLTPMRGMIAMRFENVADTYCPGDLIMGRLTKAEISPTAFTYTLNQVVGLGTFNDVSEACRSIGGSHYKQEPGQIWSQAYYHASTHELDEEESRALARTKPNHALVLVSEGSIMILDQEGITLHGLEDAQIYLEASMPEEDGIYYVDNITPSYSRDWESGHVDLDLEADWSIANAEQASMFFTRAQLQAELSDGYEIEDATSLVDTIYGLDA